MKAAIFNKLRYAEYDDASENQASYLGITVKTIVYLLVMILFASISIFALSRITGENAVNIYVGALIASVFISVISAFFSFSEKTALVGGFVFSASTGFMLGSMSAILEIVIPGIAVLAVISTVVVFLVVYLLFATGILRATNKLFGILISILACAGALALITFIMSFFFDYGDLLQILIFIQAIYVVYGAISLVYNFEDARIHVDGGLSKRSEWQVAFGFIITIYYIYLEILRLLMYILPYILKNKK